MRYVLWLVYIVLMLALGPWLLIWAINTLAAAGGATTFFIEFNFWTWLAALLINSMRANYTRRR